MSSLEKMAAALVIDLTAALTDQSGHVSIEKHASAIMARLQQEVDQMKWRQNVQSADGKLARAEVDRIKQQLADLDGKIHGAVEIGSDEYAIALMEREEALRVSLEAAEQRAAGHEALASELLHYVRVLNKALHSARAELSKIVATDRAGKDFAAMSTSSRTVEALESSIESLRENVDRARFFAQAELEQATSDPTNMSLAMLEEKVADRRFRHRIEDIRRGQRPR